MPDKPLQGKVAIVTGAGSPIGMGRAMTIALTRAGAKVLMMDINEPWLTESANYVREVAGDGSVRAVVGDTTSTSDAGTVVQTAISELGGLHILVNNAGTNPRGVGESETTQGPFWDLTSRAWDRVIAVNVNGPFHMARAAVHHMMEQKWGRIIGVTTSLDSMLRQNFSPYGPSKAAHEAFTAVIAKELDGTGVTANILVPGGLVNTNLLPPSSFEYREKMIQSDIMAAPVAWLASDESSNVTGQRFIAYHWDESLPLKERLEKAGAPAGWPQLGGVAIRPE
jgi:NAD(P)-dependent dehydrogenase (short-subunit alcohol dehydrogenase family)